MNVSPTDEFEQLENALMRAGRSIAYPETPALAAGVRAELEAPRRHALGLPRWALAALATLLIAAALLVAFPAARDALAQLLGLRTVQIFYVTPTPTATPVPFATGTMTPLPTPFATPTAKPFTQCCETTLADAQARAKFKILLPPATAPSRVYLQDTTDFIPATQQSILLFGDPSAPTFTLYEATNILYGKLVGGGTTIEETQVNGQRALWLSGAPHILVYLDANGHPQFETEQVINANTLAWEIGNVTYRLETRASEAEAIRFAESLR
jgi:hypothetical protein